MKVNIKDNSTSTEIKYPRLMVSDKGTIVLFTGNDVGTILKSDDYETGHYANDWAEQLFKPFTGTIELSND